MDDLIEEQPNLFDRVVSILEEARSNVVNSVNSNMVMGYWLIGREIVEEIQSGEKRAEYGKQIVKNLSDKLMRKYKKGFSAQSLWNFRKFYLIYNDRIENLSPPGRELTEKKKLSPEGRESIAKSKSKFATGFSSPLSWSHYRALMRVKKDKARIFYEQEAVQCGWDKRTLERHIHSQYFERMLKSQRPEAMRNFAPQNKNNSSAEVLKNPYVLEFLGLPDSRILYETELESAIINHLQSFLLELGKGFAFFGRQKRLHYEDKEFYVDLVFYNCILKFYLLIDLKMGELSHKDIGQIDSYVRMFDDLFTVEDDNPTIGLVLCTKNNETIARYSSLSERKQIFASKYFLYLPSEEELKIEMQKEKKLIEENLSSRGKK